MFSYVELIRPLNCFLAAAGVLAGGFLVLRAVSLEMMLAMVAAFLITGAGNAVNDYLDVESDRINRPKRPIPSGRVAKRHALVVILALFAAGIFMASLTNWLCFLLAVFNSLLLVVYSFNLQDKVLLGNAAVAYLSGSTFLFGGAAVYDITVPLILTAMAFLASFAREITKDLEDLEGDRRSFIKRSFMRVKRSMADRFRITHDGIKLRYKTVHVIIIACFSLGMAIAISPSPYLWGLLGFGYILVLIPTDAIFVAACYFLFKRRKYRLVSTLIKAGMALGLLAFFVGALF